VEATTRSPVKAARTPESGTGAALLIVESATVVAFRRESVTA
jgi:hypothetical protein